MKILFLSRWFPYPVNNGSKLRIYSLLKGLSREHSVTLLSFADQPDADPCRAEIRAVCAEARALPWKEFDPGSWRGRLGLFSRRPRSVVDSFSPAMAREITETLTRERFDLVIASQLPMAGYHPYFRGVPALFEEMELGLAHEEYKNAPGRGLRASLTWLKLKGYLGGLLRSFRAVTVVSKKERELATRHFPALTRVFVLPNCIDLAEYRRSTDKNHCRRLIFTGSFRYRPNYEAMRWFVDRVFPLVLEKLPDAELVITGDHAGLPLPSRHNITLMGHVENVQELVASSAVALAPLLSGGGTRLKILEAMALGTPVAATPKGAEGLDVRNGEQLLVADEPSAIANNILQILTDEPLRRRLVESARHLVQEKYDWRVVLPGFETFLESLVPEQMSARP